MELKFGGLPKNKKNATSFQYLNCLYAKKFLNSFGGREVERGSGSSWEPESKCFLFGWSFKKVKCFFTDRHFPYVIEIKNPGRKWILKFFKRWKVMMLFLFSKI